MKRDHPLNIDKNKFQAISNDLKSLVKKAREVQDKEILLGIEGNAASLYFLLFNDLILSHKQDFEFHSRQRHPPIGKGRTPHGGAWIEISSRYRTHKLRRESHPIRSAWIEIRI